MAFLLGFLLPQPRPSPPSALAAGQLSWVHPVCILTPLSHLEIHIWAMCLAMHRSLQKNTAGPGDHTHTQVGTNLGKHSCVHLHGHMPVGDWEPSHRAPGSPSPDPPPHIVSTYRSVSLSPGCVAKERHRDGYPLPRPKVTLAGPSPSFPFSMPTCKDPCVVLWASLSSSIHLPSQSPSWAKNKNCEFLDTVYFIS